MRYRNDPYWTRARYRGVCSRCHSEVKPGERLFIYPRKRNERRATVFCDMPACGQAASADFEAAAFDESVTTGSR